MNGISSFTDLEEKKIKNCEPNFFENILAKKSSKYYVQFSRCIRSGTVQHTRMYEPRCSNIF